MRLFAFILAFAIILKHPGLFALGQETPEERCGAVDATVILNACLNCGNAATCADVITNLGVPQSADDCAVGSVCDADISDGFCIPLSSALSPICMCETTGCFKDPNDPEAFVNCEIADTPATIVVACNPTATPPTPPVFNTATCECEEISNCPTCGSVASDTSECPASFYVCDPADNSILNTISCPEETCFDSSTCSCQGPTVTCPSCGKYVDPSDSTGESFCICGNFPTSCGQKCGTGTVFGTQACDCVPSGDLSSSTQTTAAGQTGAGGGGTTGSGGDTTPAVVETTTALVINCLDCGLADDPGPDCSKYYTCTTGDVIINTFYCPGNQCFNTGLCQCI